jgi:predicted nucleic acid-binding protein
LIAFDTNILIYGLTNTEDTRHTMALDLLQQLARASVIVPLPVVGKFLNACRRKKLLPADEAVDACRLWAEVYDCPHATQPDYLSAVVTADRFGLQYFDALIIAVASRAGATILLTEDMHDGLEVDGLRVVNPFVAANDAVLADYFAAWS